MIINENILKKLPINNLGSYYVVADFDRTITKQSSKTSWSILANSNLLPPDYALKRQKLYDTYRPIELDETMDVSKRSMFISEWYKKHIELFSEYKITEEIFEKAATDFRIMEFREGAVRFLRFMHDNNVPVIIISAGIGNFIETFLKKNNALFDNIFVSSNRIVFKDGVAIGVGENIIHSFNKNEVSLPQNIKEKIKGRSNVILLGDQISDLMMVNYESHKDVIKIGFHSNQTNIPIANYTESFDIVCQDDDNYNDIMDKLFSNTK